jgi:hypothetical protein
MNFAYSRQPLENLVTTEFVGEWKYLRKALFEISEQHATRACIELALFMRLLDDKEDLSRLLGHMRRRGFGNLFHTSKPPSPLKMRDVANKVIHAIEYHWDFSRENNPLLICIAAQDDNHKWVRAEIDINELAAFCGELMS